MHHLRIAPAVALVEKIKHIFLKLLAVLVYILSGLCVAMNQQILYTFITNVPYPQRGGPPLWLQSSTV